MDNATKTKVLEMAANIRRVWCSMAEEPDRWSVMKQLIEPAHQIREFKTFKSAYAYYRVWEKDNETGTQLRPNKAFSKSVMYPDLIPSEYRKDLLLIKDIELICSIMVHLSEEDYHSFLMPEINIDCDSNDDTGASSINLRMM